MSDRQDLIEKLEKASEGSRELDASLLVMQTGCKVRFDDSWDDWVVGSPRGHVEPVPHYTTSIDAALSLVPEGWRSQGYLIWPGRDEGRLINNASVDLHHFLSSGGGPKVTAFGATPALALAAAALKAQESG